MQRQEVSVRGIVFRYLGQRHSMELVGFLMNRPPDLGSWSSAKIVEERIQSGLRLAALATVPQRGDGPLCLFTTLATLERSSLRTPWQTSVHPELPLEGAHPCANGAAN
jgi:hypothetical protein